jgi:hypothetical protein
VWRCGGQRSALRMPRKGCVAGVALVMAGASRQHPY